MRRWKGLKALVHDAVDHTTALIEEGHASAARVALRVADVVAPESPSVRAVEDARRAVTAGVLAQVRAVNRAVERASDVAIEAVEGALEDRPGEERAVPMRSDRTGTAAWIGDAALGALNGVVGDHLAARANGLALEMSLRAGDALLAPEALPDALPGATGRVAVLVHGLCATEWSWCLDAENYHGDPTINFGTLLARDLGFTPLFARYNSGRHVSSNGRDLAALLERALARWPVPVTEVALVGHSMGGLVARSAAQVADREGMEWRRALTRVACLGSPHRGAPLEKLGNVLAGVLSAVDLPGTRIPGRILQGRSAGIKDLRYGYVRDEDWEGLDPDEVLADRGGPIALLDGVAYCFVAATVTRDTAHPLGVAVGDLLVRPASASPDALRRTAFPIETARFGAVLHHQLQCHPDVYAQLQAFLGGAR